MKRAVKVSLVPMERKAHKPTPHLRQAEIEAGQPPMKTMRGVGNGKEREHGYGRGS